MTDATIAFNAFKPGNRRIRVGMRTAIDVTGQRFGKLIAAWFKAKRQPAG